MTYQLLHIVPYSTWQMPEVGRGEEGGREREREREREGGRERERERERESLVNVHYII